MGQAMDDVLDAVLDSYVQHPHIGKIGEKHFPKRHLILEALRKLQCIIFPGFFDEKELRSDNIRFYTGQLLQEIRETLLEQVAKTLRLFKDEAIAKLPPNRQNAASEGEERKRSVVTTLSLSDEAIAPRREGGWDESFAIDSFIRTCFIISFFLSVQKSHESVRLD